MCPNARKTSARPQRRMKYHQDRSSGRLRLWTRGATGWCKSPGRDGRRRSSLYPRYGMNGRSMMKLSGIIDTIVALTTP